MPCAERWFTTFGYVLRNKAVHHEAITAWSFLEDDEHVRTTEYSSKNGIDEVMDPINPRASADNNLDVTFRRSSARPRLQGEPR